MVVRSPDKLVILLDQVPRTALNMTGYVSERLTITSIHSKVIFPSKAQVFMWNAVCSCGNKQVVNGPHFLSKAIKSCGCLNQERSSRSKQRYPVNKDAMLPPSILLKVPDLAGRKFPDITGSKRGSLTVLEVLHGRLYFLNGKNKKTRSLTRKLVTWWKCLCDCGNTVTRSSSYLSLLKTHPSCQTCRRKPEIRALKHRKTDTDVQVGS